MPSLRSATFIILLNIIPSSWAIDADYWQCTAFDQDSTPWVSNHQYERTATNQALAYCKKESPAPNSCKVAHEACEFFHRGVSSRPSWQCAALDQEAKSWESNPYPARDDAAIAAKAYCKERSAYPDSCYVHVLTCVNLTNKH